MRILFTGGRAPATLEWARLAVACGHQVWIAESLPWTVSSFSRRLAGWVTVAGPRHHFEDFVADLIAAVTTHQIDVLIPTCEEAFWVSRAKARLAEHCEVFVPELSDMRRMHSKMSFIDVAKAAGVAVPRTIRVTDREALMEGMGQGRELVLKPEYSRFGTDVMIKPTAGELAQVHPSAEAPWVIQDWVEGVQYATWSVCRDGRVAAHSAYEVVHRAGVGSAVHFRSARQEALEDAVTRIAAHTQWTGQLAFDFLVPPGGDPVVIECNPRLTSGIHLFRDQPAIADTVMPTPQEPMHPTAGATAQVALPMMIYGLGNAVRDGRVADWARAFVSTRDVLWRWGDPMPAVGQVLSVGSLVWRGWRMGISPLAASTYDIEWNGE